MSLAATIILLAVLWAAVSGTFTLPALVLGGAVAALALWVLRARLGPRTGRGRVVRLTALILLFLRELILSAISVALWTLRPGVGKRLRPAIVAFPLTVDRDLEITLLANMITLTPGTLSVDVSADRKWLYVHALDCRDPEALKAGIASGFERKILEAFR
jgi:multicomponent Na+:H+ antiporter subunit E